MEPLNHDGEPLHTGDDERIDLVTSILAWCDECQDEDLDWSDVNLGIREDCQKLDALLIQTIAREREREALLLQRGQAIAELQAEVEGRLFEAFRAIPTCYDTPADHYRELARRLVEDRDAQKHHIRQLETDLTARAQAIAQGQAALERTRVYIRTAMNSGGIKAIINASAWERGQREGLQHALNAINAEFQQADAARVARAPQPEQEP